MKDLRRLFALILFIVAVGCVANAQSNVVRNGNVFEFSTTRSAKSEPTKTKFIVKKDDKEYPVYMSANGSCFILKVSSKTGKEYRQYLGPEISQQMCKELGVEYKGKKK